MSPRILIRLAQSLEQDGQKGEALALLRWGRGHNPTDFWLHIELASRCRVTPGNLVELEEAIGCYRAALAVRPGASTAHYFLGAALATKNQLDEAIAEYKTAVELDPSYAVAHDHLGWAFHLQGKPDQAIAACQTAVRLQPKVANYHNSLGIAFFDKGEFDKAIAEYHTAIDLDPTFGYPRGNLFYALKAKGQKDALAHLTVANTLQAKNQLDAAIAEYDLALALDPRFAAAHYGRGRALGAKDQLDAAVAAYRRAIEFQPTFAEAHCNLGSALRHQGHLTESLASYRRGHELGSKQSGWRHNSAEWLRQAERLAFLETVMPKLRAGAYQPRDNGERLELTEVCRLKRLDRVAVDLYIAAFDDAPELADDMKAGHRYQAACAAVRAAAKPGTDLASLDDTERSCLRSQGREWLRADLTIWHERFKNGTPEDRKLVSATVLIWQREAGLMSVHDPQTLKNLPADEQALWRSLWQEVAKLEKASGGN